MLIIINYLKTTQKLPKNSGSNFNSFVEKKNIAESGAGDACHIKINNTGKYICLFNNVFFNILNWLLIFDVNSLNVCFCSEGFSAIKKLTELINKGKKAVNRKTVLHVTVCSKEPEK